MVFSLMKYKINKIIKRVLENVWIRHLEDFKLMLTKANSLTQKEYKMIQIKIAQRIFKFMNSLSEFDAQSSDYKDLSIRNSDNQSYERKVNENETEVNLITNSTEKISHTSKFSNSFMSFQRQHRPSQLFQQRDA